MVNAGHSMDDVISKVMRERGVDRRTAEKIVINKTKKARLLKLRIAATGMNFDEPTKQDRRNKIQVTRHTNDYKDTPKGKDTQAQRRVRQEVEYINRGEKIRPTKADQKMTRGLRRKLAKITKGNTTYDRKYPEDIVDEDDINKNVKPLGGTKSKKEKLPPSSVTKRYAKEHGHSIVFKGNPLGVYRAASLQEQQGKYAKYWLLNAKQTNGNGWGIASHTAKENMKKFIGRPLVVTSAKWHGASVYGDRYEHPYLPTDDLNQIFAHQEQFRVGSIIDVGEKNGDWYATVEMLPRFASYNLPPFCSPAIYQLDAQEPEGSISKWEALHLAALDENPAYGARIALLKGTCVGTPNECKVQFKSAKLQTSIQCPKKLKERVSKLKKTKK